MPENICGEDMLLSLWCNIVYSVFKRCGSHKSTTANKAAIDLPCIRFVILICSSLVSLSESQGLLVRAMSYVEGLGVICVM